MQLELFDTMVVPILLYGAEVWSFENCNIRLSPLYLKFISFVYE
jgi:hypothetical protein